MKESAADWLSKLLHNVVGDFGLLRAAFLDRFVPNQFQDELEPLLRQKQVSSENIQTYSNYFLGILGQMTDPPSISRACKMFEAQLLPEICTCLSIRNWGNLVGTDYLTVERGTGLQSKRAPFGYLSPSLVSTAISVSYTRCFPIPK